MYLFTLQPDYRPPPSLTLTDPSPDYALPFFSEKGSPLEYHTTLRHLVQAQLDVTFSTEAQPGNPCRGGLRGTFTKTAPTPLVRGLIWRLGCTFATSEYVV